MRRNTTEINLKKKCQFPNSSSVHFPPTRLWLKLKRPLGAEKSADFPMAGHRRRRSFRSVSQHSWNTCHYVSNCGIELPTAVPCNFSLRQRNTNHARMHVFCGDNVSGLIGKRLPNGGKSNPNVRKWKWTFFDVFGPNFDGGNWHCFGWFFFEAFKPFGEEVKFSVIFVCR